MKRIRCPKTGTPYLINMLIYLLFLLLSLKKKQIIRTNLLRRSSSDYKGLAPPVGAADFIRRVCLAGKLANFLFGSFRPYRGIKKKHRIITVLWLPRLGQRISFSLFTNQRPGQQHSSCPLLCGKQFTGLFPLRSNPCVSFRRTGCESSTGLKIKEIPLIVYLFYFGSPSWTRTNDPAVNSRMLYRLSYRGLKIRRRPTLPGRVRPSTIGAERLNFCVRYGYRWFPFAFVTEIVEYAFSSHRTFTTAYVLSP